MLSLKERLSRYLLLLERWVHSLVHLTQWLRSCLLLLETERSMCFLFLVEKKWYGCFLFVFLIFSCRATLHLVLCVCLFVCLSVILSSEFGLDLERFRDSSFQLEHSRTFKKSRLTDTVQAVLYKIEG